MNIKAIDWTNNLTKIVLHAAVVLLVMVALTVVASPVSAQTNPLIDDTKCTGGAAAGCIERCTDPALGAADACKTTATTDPSLKGCDKAAGCNIVNKYLNPFIKFLTIVVGIAVVMGIIIGGIQYSSSGGDPQKVATAKTRIRNAVIALLAYFFIYAFIQFLTPGGGLSG